MAGELDLDAFLSDDDVIPRDDDDTIPLRTVDEILNSPSSSSSSDAESESETAPKSKTKDQIVSQSSLPAPGKLETRQETVTTPVNTLRNRSTSLDLPSSSSSSSSDTLTSLVLRGLSDRPLPPLFRGVRVANPRPGAALAAAAAASRSVATPHAAAIKLRRVDPASRSLQKEKSGGVDEDVKKVEIEREYGASSCTLDITGNLEELSVSKNADENMEKESEGDNVELVTESKSEETISSSSETENAIEGQDVQNLNENVTLDHFQSDENLGFQKIKEEKVEELVHNSELITKSELVAELKTDHGDQNLKEIESKQTEINQTLETLDKISPIDDEPEPTTPPTLEIAENLNDEASETQVDDLIEKAVEIAKKAEKKLKSSMKPLEYYEEIEKRQASYGLHYEEGAVAQPMRLEGIRRGPPAVGYLQIDLDNAATRLISSQGFRREHGSPQVVVVHRSYIAFGMSRGTVFAVPSKYSIHSSDHMDSKVCMSGSGTVTYKIQFIDTLK